MENEENTKLGGHELRKIIVVIGLIAAGYGLWQWYKASSVAGWEQVPGIVVTSRFMPPNRAQIIFKYRPPNATNLEYFNCAIMPEQDSVRISRTAGGRLSRLQSCRNRAAVFDSRQEAEQIVERFPVDKPVQVYFGEASYLDPHPYRSPWWYWIIGGGALALAGLLALILSSNKEEEASAEEDQAPDGGGE